MNAIRKPSSLRKRSGFTLIEVLFATLAFSIVLAAINSVFYTSIRLRERVSAKHAIFTPRIQALELIKQDLRATFFSEGFRADRFLAEPLSGSNTNTDHLQFFTASGQTREEAPWSNIQMVQYYLAPTLDPRNDPNSLDLVRAVTRNLLTSTVPPPIEQPLVNGVRSFNLNFFDGEIWQETWDSDLQDPVLPKAVQIYLEFDTDTDADTQRGQSPPSLTHVVSILEAPRQGEDEEGEAADGEDGASSSDNPGGGSPTTGGGSGQAGATNFGDQGQQGGRN